MNLQRSSPFLVLLSLIFVLMGCGETTQPGSDNPEQYLESDYNEGLGSSQAIFAVWAGNRIYTTWPIRYYDLDANGNVLQDSVPFAYTETNVFPAIPDSVLHGYSFIRGNLDGSKLLAVKSEDINIASGSLDEIDTRTFLTAEVLPKGRNVSSALYLSDDSIIYYTDAPTSGAAAGYYLYVRSADKHTLILPFDLSSEIIEPVNGFDYSKPRNTLILPALKDGIPKIIEFNLGTSQVDTLPVSFEAGRARQWLHLRYSADGSQVLYSNYGSRMRSTELGVIKISDNYSKQLISRPGVPDDIAISLDPEWSPTGSHIVICASRAGNNGSAEWLKGLILKLP